MLTVTRDQLEKLPEAIRKNMAGRLATILRRDGGATASAMEDAEQEAFVADVIEVAEAHALHSEAAALRLMMLMLHHGVRPPLDGTLSLSLGNIGAKEADRLEEFRKTLEQRDAPLTRVTLDMDIEPLRRPR